MKTFGRFNENFWVVWWKLLGGLMKTGELNNFLSSIWTWIWIWIYRSGPTGTLLSFDGALSFLFFYFFSSFHLPLCSLLMVPSKIFYDHQNCPFQLWKKTCLTKRMELFSDQFETEYWTWICCFPHKDFPFLHISYLQGPIGGMLSKRNWWRLFRPIRTWDRYWTRIADES